MRTQGSSGDPEVLEEPGGPGGARRFPLTMRYSFGTLRSFLFILGPRLEPGGGVGIRRFYDRSGDRGWNPEVSVIVIGPGDRARVHGFPLDPEIVSGPWCIWTLRSHENPEAFEAVLEPGGLDPEITVWNPKVL
ncbi:hypothetical protein F2Q70_00002971 [Brassica cretica]|uniref:Uncharacterized protein n=1 Tax=Brassica cretica TaxID=69181 RepID=A0A8S9J1J7_BRACR|nr:hypothetical protein F2Q70_00002971 [Brassica cretica]